MYSSGQALESGLRRLDAERRRVVHAVFGYMNTNWQQEFDIPVGAAERDRAGGPDQGQPTHFYPRRNPFLFSIRVPADFGTKELIWTLTANGKTREGLRVAEDRLPDRPQVISTEVGGDFGSLRDELRTNIPPELTRRAKPSAA